MYFRKGALALCHAYHGEAKILAGAWKQYLVQAELIIIIIINTPLKGINTGQFIYLSTQHFALSTK